MPLSTWLILLVCIAALAVFSWRAMQNSVRAVNAEMADTRCMHCAFFELEAAQEAMRMNPAFVKMTLIQSPYMSGRRVKYVDDGPCPDCAPDSNESCKTCSGDRRITRAVHTYPEHLTPQAKWSEHGWCTNPNIVYDGGVSFTERIIWGGCANCDGKLFQLRAKKPELRAVS